MSKRTADDAVDANPGSSKRPKLPLVNLGRLVALSDYRRDLIEALYSIFETNKSEERKWLLLSFVTARLIHFGLWASAEVDEEKAREMKDVFAQYLVVPPSPAGQEPTCWLRDRDQALIKRADEVKDELANCRFKLHEVAGKLENATKLVASLRAQNTGLEMDLMKSNETMSMAGKEVQKNTEALKQSLEKINQMGIAFTGAEAKRRAAEAALEKTQLAWNQEKTNVLGVMKEINGKSDLLAAQLMTEETRRQAAEAALEKTRLDWEEDSKKNRDILWDKVKEADLRLMAEETKRAAAEEALKKLQGEFEKAQDELRQAQLYRERVEEDLANATVAAQKFKDEIAQFKENADNLTAENKSLGETLDREVDHSKRVGEKAAALENKKEVMAENLQKYGKRMHEKEAEIEKLQKEVVDLKDSLKNNDIYQLGFDKQRAELQAEIDRLKQQLHTAEKVRDARYLELEFQTEQLTHLKQGIERYREEVEGVLQERAALRLELAGITKENAVLQKEKEELEQKLEIARSDKEAMEDDPKTSVKADYNFFKTLKMGDFVAVMHTGSDNGDNYWLASVIGTKPKQHEIHVMYYEEAGASGYRGWANGKTQWIKEFSVKARIDRLPATGVEREALHAALHAPDE